MFIKPYVIDGLGESYLRQVCNFGKGIVNGIVKSMFLIEVVKSSKRYRSICGLLRQIPNPTHGSGWFVSDPFYKNSPKLNFNPTHGSGWILQIR